MENSEWLELIFPGLMGTAPGLILWIAVLVLSVRLLRRDGGRAERFLIAGAGVCIFGSLFYIPQLFIAPLLFSSGSSMENFIGLTSGIRIAGDIVHSAGLVCFIYAFWIKFNAGRTVRGENLIDTQYRGETGI
jgi:hypothetical protein